MDIRSPRELCSQLTTSIEKAFVGNRNAVRLLIMGLVSGLNVLIEDIPGVGKTTLARSLARATGLDFARIQFSPDLLPGDVTGTSIWSQERREFVFKPGAIMHQFVLADELNRASARTQSALLEAMQERSVTVDGVTYALPEPFFLVATQNPVHFSGTFALPEAQLDRFGISFRIGYPTSDDALGVLDRMDQLTGTLLAEAVTGTDAVLELRTATRAVHANADIKGYIVRIAEATRTSKATRLGMSPRSTQHLLATARARALLEGRAFVVPEDVAESAPAVLRHRLLLSPEERMAGHGSEEIVEQILADIPMPTGVT
jgi:MoxR-like ATPase